MEGNSRIINSIKNAASGLASQFISLILSFIVRTVFIRYLGNLYLGVNGLFTNILTILSLAELGFGVAIVYSLYAPLAHNDTKKIQSIMNLYSRVYKIIGVIVGVMGLSIIPFMDIIIKDNKGIYNLTLIYVLFLLDSVCSYFFSYKRSILSADQKEYMNSRYKYIFTVIKSISQVIILILFENFIFYLLIQIITTLLENIFISKKVDKIYPYLKIKNSQKLQENEFEKIVEDVKALILTKVGHVMLNGTDNIIISSLVGISWVGLLSNYTMIIGSLVMIISQITSSITGSVGNYMAKENKENKYNLFKRVDFIIFWIYGFSTICLVVLLNPFIELWLCKDYILNESIIIVLAINFFISGIMSVLWIFRSTMGLFTQGKYRAIICAILNMAISIMLAKKIGLIGVLLGTTISRLVVNLWYDPYIIYKYGFNKSVKEYYIKYLWRTLLITFICIILNMIKVKIIQANISIILFCILLTICLIIPNFILILIYNKDDSVYYIKNTIKEFL